MTRKLRFKIIFDKKSGKDIQNCYCNIVTCCNVIHCESKKYSTKILSQLHKIFTDFQNSFTDTLWKICEKVITKDPTTL